MQHDGLTLTDSHTILIYLAQLHETTTLLPPTGTKQWFEVLDRLLFNAATLFRRDSDAFVREFTFINCWTHCELK